MRAGGLPGYNVELEILCLPLAAHGLQVPGDFRPRFCRNVSGRASTSQIFPIREQHFEGCQAYNHMNCARHIRCTHLFSLSLWDKMRMHD
jgi:hypothetical protein